MQEENSSIRSFIVLMDKNKDTQWLEDGKFVGNPLVFQKPKQAVTNMDALAALTGLEYVSDFVVTHNGDYVTYDVTGMHRNGLSLQARRMRVAVYFK